MGFSVNDVVIVDARRLQSHNQIGVIVGFYSNTSSKIRFSNWNNRGEKELTIKNIYLKKYSGKKGDVTMALEGRYMVAMVKFLQGMNTTKEYAFASFEPELEVGDIVVCDTSNGYGIAKVSRMIEQDDYVGTSVTKEIVCKIDMAAFEKRKAERTQRANLIKKMDKVAKENQNMHLYQMIAETNPEMRKLLEEFNNIGQ